MPSLDHAHVEVAWGRGIADTWGNSDFVPSNRSRGSNDDLEDDALDEVAPSKSHTNPVTTANHHHLCELPIQSLCRISRESLGACLLR